MPWHKISTKQILLHILTAGGQTLIYVMAWVMSRGDGLLRLIVNINDLKRKNPARSMGLLSNASDEQLAFGRALKEYLSTVDPTYSKTHEDFFVGFEGCFGNRHVTPRSLKSIYFGNLVCVEGIVTKVSLIHPKVVRSVHYFPDTKKVMERKYTDIYQH